MNRRQRNATIFALLAAVLYALNSPLSKLLLGQVSPTTMAALLYLGAGLGLAITGGVRRLAGIKSTRRPLNRSDTPYIIGMVVLDIAAPVLLMTGLTLTTAANAALLNNFEIVATSLIALCLFGEKISWRLWLAIGLVTVSSVILSFEDMSSLSFSAGSLLVLLACVCWGFENNCTRKLSDADPLTIVVIKGFCSGGGALAVAFARGETLPRLLPLCGALALGFVAYGLSIYFYIHAQRDLGAAKTSAYYAAAPFVGAALSLIIFRQLPDAAYLAALVIMIAGSCLATADTAIQSEQEISA
ncbi:MAG: DMT family transporter [Ruminococcaceae bacterium]|nr:DMT family transporter [Oscillospiraceae bacterium]